MPRSTAIERSGAEGAVVPGPRGRRLLGSLMEVRRHRLRFVRNAMREYGDAVAFRMGPKRLFLMASPQAFRHVLCHRADNYVKGIGLLEARPLLGEGLLTAEGEHAVCSRLRVRPVFQKDRLPTYAEAISKAAGAMLDHWEEEARSGGVLPVDWEMVRLTLGVLDRTLLDTGLELRARALHDDLVEFTDWAMDRMAAILPLPLAFPTPANLRAKRSLRQLERWVEEAVEEREAQEPKEDLLGILLSDGVHRREIRDQLLTFLLAGHETTAVTLSWMWNLLARHPEAERRLHEEVDRVLGSRPAGLEDLADLPYTQAVVDETLRLYPPVWLIPRRSLGADTVAGYAIPARSDVLLSVYSLHRHPAIWEDPERFAPERFLGDQEAHPGAFLPFGAGRRSCLGSGFGLLEARLVLATVAGRFRLELVEPDEVPANPSLTLRPDRPVRLRPVARR